MRLLLFWLMASAAFAAPKKVVLIAGKKSHGPGLHEYVKSVKLLKVMLDRSPSLRGQVKTEVHFNGWPEDPRTLDTADTIVFISDGQDGDKYSPVPFMTPERLPVMERQMKRGCGLMVWHFSVFAPDRLAPQILDWGGGYFDWQGDDGQRQWYSAIKTLEADVQIGDRSHPVARGIDGWRYKEEFYYKMRFAPADARRKPVLLVPALGGSADDHTVAWAVERADGGRGFGATIGHFYDDWRRPELRKLLLNAIAWTAKVDVPAAGVESAFVEDAEVDRALVPRPVPTLLITGDDHPGHKWKETHVAVMEALQNRGPEFQITVSQDAEALKDAGRYRLVVLHYANWTRPGLSENAKSAFARYVKNGGGVVVIHFANGAFHASLPQAPPSDWPEYRAIVPRIWDHAKDKSGHDKYGRFRVRVTDQAHPITKGLADFETVDELYFRQQGTAPVRVLAVAHSKITGQDEPMALVHQYGKGRVFQTLLGHSVESLSTPGVIQLLRRGAAWAAAAR